MTTQQFIDRCKAYELIERTDRGIIFYNSKLSKDGKGLKGHFIAVANNRDVKNGETKSEVSKWLREWDQSCKNRREYFGSLVEFMNLKQLELKA